MKHKTSIILCPVCVCPVSSNDYDVHLLKCAQKHGLPLPKKNTPTQLLPSLVKPLQKTKTVDKNDPLRCRICGKRLSRRSHKQRTMHLCRMCARRPRLQRRARAIALINNTRNFLPAEKERIMLSQEYRTLVHQYLYIDPLVGPAREEPKHDGDDDFYRKSKRIPGSYGSRQ